MNFCNVLKRLTGMFLAVVLFTGAAVQTSFAATSYVNTVNITLNIDLEVGEHLPDLSIGYTGDDTDVMIPGNNRYDIESAEWSSSSKTVVELGGVYTLKVTLRTLNDYKFNPSYSSGSVNVKGGEFVSGSRSSSSKLVITLKTRPVKGTLESPDDLYWETTLMDSPKLGRAQWTSVSDAAYEVWLYRGTKCVYKSDTLYTNSFNFYPYMTQKGTYKFKVRCIPANDEISQYASKSEWVESGELVLEDGYQSDGTGASASGSPANTPETDKVGWIEDNGFKYFRYPTGVYLRDGWLHYEDDDGNWEWYLFDASGVMQTGWVMVDGLDYFLNEDGSMFTGWLSQNGSWYYLHDDGHMVTGWLSLGDDMYYMDDCGKMVTGWNTIGNDCYYFYPDGHMARNEKVDGFYLDMNGAWDPNR